VTREAPTAVWVPGLRREFEAIAREAFERRVALARRVYEIDRDASFVYESCASMEEFLVRTGMPRFEARLLVDLGNALAAAPELEEKMRSGAIGVESAAMLWRVLRQPHLVRPGENWIEKAAALQRRPDPVGALRREIRRREEEHAQKKSTVNLSLDVTEESLDMFGRARTIASRRAGTTLTYGQTFAVITTDYVRRHDPLLVRPGKRRMGPVGSNPHGSAGSRTIPAEVQRAVRARAGDKCEIPGCENRIHLEFAHIHPHRDGGGREADDLFLLCGTHHVLFDLGLIHFRGTVAQPVFVTAEGHVLGGTFDGCNGALPAPARPDTAPCNPAMHEHTSHDDAPHDDLPLDHAAHDDALRDDAPHEDAPHGHTPRDDAPHDETNAPDEPHGSDERADGERSGHPHDDADGASKIAEAMDGCYGGASVVTARAPRWRTPSRRGGPRREGEGERASAARDRGRHPVRASGADPPPDG
jgi:hypothetical protein